MDEIRRNPDIEKAEALCNKCFYNNICKEYERVGVLKISVTDRTWSNQDCHLFIDANNIKYEEK